MVWRRDSKTGRKPLINPATKKRYDKGQSAAVDDPATWGSYDEAVAAKKRLEVDGIGFVFTADDSYCGIDLDKCIGMEPERAAWAAGIVRAVGSYTELSPSGRGLHILVRATLPEDGRKDDDLGLEMYHAKRYFTFTGNLWEHSLSRDIEERQEAVGQLFVEHFGAVETKQAEQPTLEAQSHAKVHVFVGVGGQDIDGRLAEMLRKSPDVLTYWQGGNGRHGDNESGADIALIGRLVRWFGEDRALVESLFERSQRLDNDERRKKWEREDYRAGMFEKAVSRARQDVWKERTQTPRDQWGRVKAKDAKPSAYAVEEGEGTDPGLEPDLSVWEKYTISFSGHIANARRLCASEGGWRLRWSVEEECWLFWDGRLWRRGGGAKLAARDLSMRVTRLIEQEIAEAKAAGAADGVVKPMRKWLDLSGKWDVFENSLKTAAVGLAVEADELDRYLELLTVGNGTLELDGPVFRPSRAADLMTVGTPVRFDPEADYPKWRAFLERVIPDDAVRWFLQKAVGYSLSGRIDLQCWFFLLGEGANGKSTFLELLDALLGGYSRVAVAELLMSGAAERHSTELHDLRGSRAVICSEVERGSKFAIQRVKSLSTDAVQRARAMFRDNEEFRNTTHVWLAANHKPVVDDPTDAFWRRMRLVPFDVQIPEGERDGRLKDELLSELSGILNWALLGYQGVLAEGLEEPQAMREAAADYRYESDAVGAFVAEYCVPEEGAELRSEHLFILYQGWKEAQGEKVGSQTAFVQELKNRKMVEKHGPVRRIDIDGEVKQRRMLVGLRLKTQQERE